MRLVLALVAAVVVLPGCEDDCSGHGILHEWDGTAYCACDTGYTATAAAPATCVPTADVCKGGAIDFDVDGDGTNEAWFDPNAAECEMYEIVNRVRAMHDTQGTPECHVPLEYDVEWSAHARNHSLQMQAQGDLFHADYPSGQNCAYGCGALCEMDMYMNGSGEGHCPPLSHHCNIMRCGWTRIGVGTVDNWNTQNFL